jgi:serine/threonine protein kinase
MLQIDPTDRVSASECLIHPWITGRSHKESHLEPLPEVQEAVRARLERRRRKKLSQS